MLSLQIEIGENFTSILQAWRTEFRNPISYLQLRLLLSGTSLLELTINQTPTNTQTKPKINDRPDHKQNNLQKYHSLLQFLRARYLKSDRWTKKMYVRYRQSVESSSNWKFSSAFRRYLVSKKEVVLCTDFGVCAKCSISVWEVEKGIWKSWGISNILLRFLGQRIKNGKNKHLLTT